jgi:hypothetical protein
VTHPYGRQIVLAWESFKDWFSFSVHLTHHELHVVIGLVLFLVFSRLFRVSLASFLPLAPVALLELLNETSDYVRYRIDDWPWTPGPTLLDIALTLGPSVALILVVRIWGLARRARIVNG